MKNHLEVYLVNGELDLIHLVHDDFCLAIKSAFNARHFTSSLKLLLSFIDTMSFLYSGSSKTDEFKKWVDRFVDLSPIGITADELWQHRNGLLHISGYESDKVKQGKYKMLIPFVGKGEPQTNGVTKNYSLQLLITNVMLGVAACCEEVKGTEERLLAFLGNYEKTISDSHFARYGKKG